MTHRKDGKEKEKMLERFFKINLHLFDGEGSAPAPASGTGTEQTAETSMNNDVDSKIPWDLVGGKPAELQEETVNTETNTQSNTETQNRPSFEDLIKGEYAEDYKSHVSSTIKDRVKNLNAEKLNLQKQLDSSNGVMELLASKYGKDISDLEGIKTILENEHFEQLALDNGTSVTDERKAFKSKQIELENEQLKQDIATRQMWAELHKQSNELKNMYPDFDLNNELESEDFKKALLMTKHLFGVENVQKAYEMTHLDALREQAVKQTAKQASLAFTNNMMAQQYLPSENGNSGNFGGSPKRKSVEDLSGAEIQKMIEDQKNGKSRISDFFN